MAGCAACGNKQTQRQLEIAAAQNSQIAQQPDLTSQLVRPVPSFTPHTFRFRDETEPPTTFEDTNLDLMMARIVQFRFENKLAPILHLKQVVLHFTMLSDEAYAPYREYYYTSTDVHVSAKQYLKAALAFVQASTIMKDEDLFVDQAEAERRATVCLNCPRNIHYINGHDANSPTLGQSKFCQLAKGKTTTADGALGVCGVCTCINKCKVHFKQDFIRKASTLQLLGQFEQEYLGKNGKPHKCWIADK